jgi:hypothetical protein
MRPRERRETSEQDLFRSRLDQIIDMKHALVQLARAIDWGFLEQTFGAVYTDKPGQPPLPTRLMAGLSILKHTYDLSDEALCDRWVENPYFQYFCGEEFFQHALVFDRSSLTCWRQRMGEDKLKALLPESLAVATRTDAKAPEDADGARTAGSLSFFPISVYGITHWTDRDGRRTSITAAYPRGIKCPTLLLSLLLSWFSLVFCSFLVRRLPMKWNRSQHCALGAIFKLSGRLDKK